MSAKQKLEEAEFYLHKLHELQSLPQDADAQKALKHYLSAFLSASVSVPDYLLEDFNIKFCLNIPLSERRFRDKFEREARRTGNQTALGFIQWWRKQNGTLRRDPVGRVLIGKRHIEIHRVQVKPDLVKITVKETLPITESVELKLFNKEGKLVETRKGAEQPAPRPKETETTFDWFFSEYPDEPVIIVCEKFLGKLTSLVSEAEQNFSR